MSASMHLVGSAAHWYQAVKLTPLCVDSTSFKEAALQELSHQCAPI